MPYATKTIEARHLKAGDTIQWGGQGHIKVAEATPTEDDSIVWPEGFYVRFTDSAGRAWHVQPHQTFEVLDRSTFLIPVPIPTP